MSFKLKSSSTSAAPMPPRTRTLYIRKDHDLMDKLNIIINLFSFLPGFTWTPPNLVIQMPEKVINIFRIFSYGLFGHSSSRLLADGAVATEHDEFVLIGAAPAKNIESLKLKHR